MKNTKILNTLSLIMIAALLITGCRKKDPEPTYAQPTITDLELGYNNSMTGYQGQDLHIDAMVAAEAKM